MKCPKSPILIILKLFSFINKFHSFTDADMHLFQSLDLMSIDDNSGYCRRRPIQICSLLIFVRTTLGQLIRYEMSKVARERDLMIPFITIIFHLNSCTKVVLFYQYITDISSIVQIVLVFTLFMLKQYLFSSP